MVSLLANEFIGETWWLVEICVVYGLAGVFWILLVHVGVLVFVVGDIFECKPANCATISVNDDSFEKWFACHTVLHPPDNLEFIRVNGAYMCNCGCCKCGIFILILFDKSTSDFGEFKIVIIL